MLPNNTVPGQRRRKTLGLIEVAAKSTPSLAITTADLPPAGPKSPEIKKQLLNRLLSKFKGTGHDKEESKDGLLSVQAPKRRPSVLGVRLPIKRKSKVKAIIDDEKAARPTLSAEMKPIGRLKKSSSLHELSGETSSARKSSTTTVVPPMPKAQPRQDDTNAER
jgi:hypothetical protein